MEQSRSLSSHNVGQKPLRKRPFLSAGKILYFMISEVTRSDLPGSGRKGSHFFETAKTFCNFFAPYSDIS